MMHGEVSTTRVSGWVKHSAQVDRVTHLLTQVVLTPLRWFN